MLLARVRLSRCPHKFIEWNSRARIDVGDRDETRGAVSPPLIFFLTVLSGIYDAEERGGSKEREKERTRIRPRRYSDVTN